MEDDLMTAINAEADRAEEAKPAMTDLHALAMTLNQDFDERSVKEIEQKLIDVWRARGLYWRE
ncbi:hypothetical protein ACDY96_21290 [Rhizobium mongolense]|uniref:hypothetical protein n=1 Tax=Rhizobium mongolense TaxID=57676 RepID=UPI003558C634